jgi:gamma-glutamyltranspeptidase/glutathione hydrolase
MKLRYICIIVALCVISACHYNDLPFVKPTKPVARVHDTPKETISPEIATGRNHKPIVTAKKFMVVSANPLATKAGQKILRNGGSAVDAAIAVQAVLNVVEPQSSGIGGGGFLVHFDKKSNNIIAYDGREVAPSHAKPTLFLDKNGKPIPFAQAATGGKAVAVPAVLKMLALAHKEQGKLPWKDLFNDAIDIAKNGYPLTERLQLMLQVAPEYRKHANHDFKRYLNADGSVKKTGDVIYNKPLAQTFTKIAMHGADAFYTGDIADDIIKTVSNDNTAPSSMTLADLKNYSPKKRVASCILYHKYKLCGMPPPSSGGVTVLQALKMLERFNLNDYDYYNPQHIHLTASSLRLAYADRNKYLADPDFISVPTDALLSETYLRKRSELINPTKAIDIAPAGDPSEAQTQFASLKTSEPPSTTHISIVDSYGNAVSFTSTIERAFGSGLATKSGFILNNQMTDFDFIAEKDGVKIANSIEGNKRPRSSMSPFLIFTPKGQLMSVIGSPGGARIISFVLPRILSLIHSKKPINTMLASPNMTAMMPEAVIELEAGIDLKNLDTAMIKYGYTPIVTDLTSGLHLIHIKNGVLYGTADPRREGVALGE